MTRRTTRRGLFGGGPSLMPLAAAAAGDAKAQELDGELLALCTEFLRAEETQDTLNLEALALTDESPPEAHKANDDALESNSATWFDLLDSIIDTPARTPEGLRAKAHVLRMAMKDAVVTYSQDTIHDAEEHIRLAWSLADDILGAGA